LGAKPRRFQLTYAGCPASVVINGTGAVRTNLLSAFHRIWPPGHRGHGNLNRDIHELAPVRYEADRKISHESDIIQFARAMHV
jgi:hypothetical protein